MNSLRTLWGGLMMMLNSLDRIIVTHDSVLTLHNTFLKITLETGSFQYSNERRSISY